MVRKGKVAHASLWEIPAGQLGDVIFSKTKAHRTLDEAVAQGDVEDYVGNEQVGTLAKKTRPTA